MLAGFPDERPGAVEATGGAGAASLIGLRLAKGEAVPGRGADHVIAPRATTDGPSDGTGGEPPSGHPADEPPAGHPSSHDAPQQTSASDDQHPAGPTAEEGE